MAAVSPGTAGKMLLRSLFVQAAWSFERLQNLGFFLLVYPSLEERYGEGEKLGAALRRHLDHFNTHPYFAGLVAGAVVREEGGDLDEGRFLEDLKRSLMSTLASVGDRFFWATLKPLAVLAAVLPALFGAWWAPLVLLFLYNVPHLYLRWWGIRRGLEDGCRVIEAVRRLPLEAALGPLSLIVASLAGLCAGAASIQAGWAPVPGRKLLSLACAGAVFGGGLFLAARRGGPGKAGAGAAGALLLTLICVEAAGP